MNLNMDGCSLIFSSLRNIETGNIQCVGMVMQIGMLLVLHFRRKHLAPYLPTHPVIPPYGTTGPEAKSFGVVSAAPFGSSAILPISWAYVRMMGAVGLRHASEVAILNANYMSRRLDGYYKTLYKNEQG